MGFLESFRKTKQTTQPDLYIKSDELPVETAEDRETRLRLQALENSFAPAYIEALRQSPGVRVIGEDWCPEIHIRNEERQACDVFSVVGKINGSVQVGHEILNPKVARDQELVVDAFERAFQNAILVEDSSEHNHQLHIVS